ncbi:hypothetical protein BJ138DRAFT_996509 [Hygrophoropsis aurantiaca]|uniref:Uncharacterized protein n=1 Tax=Hygrophoropsis aurantiaca TaxID=72124 RepID=A0ACB8ARW6_9AGAM|nr:hypothetical protein BJ138DRAFT_996509 [Hygrophoropsis aurantiaca]
MDDCSSFYDDLTYPSHDIGPFPDVNMYDLALARADPSGSVNPLDTIGITLNSPHDGPHDNVPLVSPIRPESQPPAEHPVQADLLADVIQNIVSIFTKSEAQECDNPSAAVSSLTKRHRSDDHLQFQSSNTELLTFPIMTSQEYTFPSDAQGSTLPEAIKTDKDNITAFQEIYPSPILNAHLGIQMDELVYRAERYRMRHTVNEIDKSWLMHFAGKLSERGELLDDFRCYIVGCGQVNKRRDHILVHVGAHIDQRPYTCTICGLRFLRKNECTRHEASHLGHRPYHCSICGQTFVRQDLVTRHLKRTHDTGKENCNRPPRKKARLQ